jgi:hypothetical protein
MEKKSWADIVEESEVLKEKEYNTMRVNKTRTCVKCYRIKNIKKFQNFNGHIYSLCDFCRRQDKLTMIGINERFKN